MKIRFKEDFDFNDMSNKCFVEGNKPFVRITENNKLDSQYYFCKKCFIELTKGNNKF